MKKLIFCTFNMDTACVELKFSDSSMIATDTIAVENEAADNMVQRSELDWLIYNKPLEYAQLVLGGNLNPYVKGTPEHLLMDESEYTWNSPPLNNDRLAVLYRTLISMHR